MQKSKGDVGFSPTNMIFPILITSGKSRRSSPEYILPLFNHKMKLFLAFTNLSLLYVLVLTSGKFWREKYMNNA